MASDLNFRKILEKLRDIHKEFPDLRFGQVLQSAIDLTRQKFNANLHEESSKKILAALTSFQEQTRKTRVIKNGKRTT